MVEIEAVVDGQNARIPADCQLNGRTYIGATAAVHPQLRPKLYANSRNSMPEVIFPGPEGRLEGRFHPGTRPRAPVAMVLHSHP